MIDLDRAADRMKDLLASVDDEDLALPTPCPDYRVADLIEHVGGLALAFTGGARKAGGALAEPSGSGDATRLVAEWRTTIPNDLDTLVEAWRDPSAWTGDTRVGGVDLPGAAAGVVALDELVLHGWDLARATGRDYSATAEEIEACLGFVEQVAGQDAAARDGIFGPPVAVADDAPAIDRLLGLAGRDPSWSAPTRRESRRQME